MSEFTVFLCGQKRRIHVKKVDGFRNIRMREEGPEIEKKKTQKSVPQCIWSHVSKLKIGRAICHGHFFISKSVLKT